MISLCEKVAFEILPALRAEVAKILKEKYNLSQNEIAEILGISQASVSYYLNGLRGKKKIYTEKIEKLCEEIVRKIINKEEFRMKLNKIACNLAKEILKGVEPCKF
jgi:predicted transcriptional regulator